MAENIDAERAALLPCAHCGGEAHLTKGCATENVWPHGEFHRVFCGACQIRQLFYRTRVEAIAAWNCRTPSASIGEDGLPELPGASARLYVQNGYRRASVLPGNGSPLYTADQMRQYAREHAAGLQASFDAAIALAGDTIDARNAEIADLRAQLARQSQPVAWLEAEPSALGRPAHEVVVSVVYSSRIHTKCAPMTSNPVWPLYAAPPLSSEQQADAAPCEMPGCSGVGPASGAITLCAEHCAVFVEWRKNKAGEQQAEKGDA